MACLSNVRRVGFSRRLAWAAPSFDSRMLAMVLTITSDSSRGGGLRKIIILVFAPARGMARTYLPLMWFVCALKK